MKTPALIAAAVFYGACMVDASANEAPLVQLAPVIDGIPDDKAWQAGSLICPASVSPVRDAQPSTNSEHQSPLRETLIGDEEDEWQIKLPSSESPERDSD